MEGGHGTAATFFIYLAGGKEQAVGPFTAHVCWPLALLIGSGSSDSWVLCLFGAGRKDTSFSCRSAPSLKVETQRQGETSVSSIINS